MSEQAHIEQQLEELREAINTSNSETQGAIRDLTKELHGFAKVVTEVVTENRYRDEKIERLEAHDDDHDKRIRKVEGSQEGNRVRWLIMGTIGAGCIAFLSGVAIWIVKPLFTIMEKMQ